MLLDIEKKKKHKRGVTF